MLCEKSQLNNYPLCRVRLENYSLTIDLILKYLMRGREAVAQGLGSGGGSVRTSCCWKSPTHWTSSEGTERGRDYSGHTQTQPQLKQQDIGLSWSSSLCFSLYVQAATKRSASFAKATQRAEMSAHSLILRSRGSAGVSRSLALFVPVQQPCFLMKMSCWIRALDAFL